MGGNAGRKALPRKRRESATVTPVGLCVPAMGTDWPTLGPYVVEWIQANLVHGPGDLKGEEVVLDEEKIALIYRMYEVWPRDHAQAGRRRFKRCAISIRKGTAKTEFAAFVAACELSRDCPVRTAYTRTNSGEIVPGFDRHGNPEPGRPPQDAYIPLLAYTEEQSDELAYSALRVIIEGSRKAAHFDSAQERIIRIGVDGRADGKAAPFASAPDSRDGARTTFQHFDETHRMNTPRLKMAHKTMLANIPKRKLADAWTLETTTAYAPGENSVAEDTHEYARAIADGRVKNARLFFFHRQAADDCDLSTERGIRAAVIQASGPAAPWSDIDSIVAEFQDPTSDPNYNARVWLNQPRRSTAQAFDVTLWDRAARPDYMPEEGALIVLGFDGAKAADSTGLIATEVYTGFQWAPGKWEKPFELEKTGRPWEIPEAEVDAVVADLFERFNVWKLFGDPPYWENALATWEGRYGKDRVVRWLTNQHMKMAYAIRAFWNAVSGREETLTHSGDTDVRRHIGNAQRRYLTQRDEKGEHLWVIQKERPDSPMKIDYAVAAVLSWIGRLEAVKAGAEPDVSIYDQRVDADEEPIEVW